MRRLSLEIASGVPPPQTRCGGSPDGQPRELEAAPHTELRVRRGDRRLAHRAALEQALAVVGAVAFPGSGGDGPKAFWTQSVRGFLHGFTSCLINLGFSRKGLFLKSAVRSPGLAGRIAALEDHHDGQTVVLE
jgi:hypothetical protein